MIARDLEPELHTSAQYFPVVALLGPRQSGKTTLVKKAFSNHIYVSLEDLDTREYAENDPRSFLGQFHGVSGVILDEIQRVPSLLSYIQTIVDEENKPGFFVLTGSQNFLIGNALSQSLAGRIAILTLLPLSIHELKKNNLLPQSIDEAVLYGSYPRVYAQSIPKELFYRGYVQTYIERDVRTLKKIATDLGVFKKFLGLCSARTGQEVNYSSLANSTDIRSNTVKSWLHILEESYIISMLQPYVKNFGKRLIKSPKSYFIDTGLVCFLLKIRSVEELQQHYLRGHLIETFIISDLIKQHYNKGLLPSVYFWRDKSGNEVDCIIEETPYPLAIEIKARKTIYESSFKELKFWSQLTGNPSSHSFLVYGGSNTFTRENAGTALSWQDIDTLIEKNIGPTKR